MKPLNILTLGIVAVIGASFLYYFKNNKMQVANNNEIDKKIDEAIGKISSTAQATEEARITSINEELKIKTELDNKEAENYLAKTLLIDKLMKLKNIQRLSFSKMTPQQREELFNTVEGSSKLPILTQIRDVEKTLKDKYGIYPNNQGLYTI